MYDKIKYRLRDLGVYRKYAGRQATVDTSGVSSGAASVYLMKVTEAYDKLPAISLCMLLWLYSTSCCS